MKKRRGVSETSHSWIRQPDEKSFECEKCGARMNYYSPGSLPACKVIQAEKIESGGWRNIVTDLQIENNRLKQVIADYLLLPVIANASPHREDLKAINDRFQAILMEVKK